MAELRALADRRLTPEEMRAALAAPMTDFEREQIDELITWFLRRYPTAAERLAYARRAQARWKRGMP